MTTHHPLIPEETNEADYPGFLDHLDCNRLRALLDRGDLMAAAQLITAATIDKEFGSGPPMNDLNRARRAWLDAYERERRA